MVYWCSILKNTACKTISAVLRSLKYTTHSASRKKYFSTTPSLKEYCMMSCVGLRQHSYIKIFHISPPHNSNTYYHAVMHCLHDNAPMRTQTIEHITIDICPVCDSVWLDGGEIQKIVTFFQENRNSDWLEQHKNATSIQTNKKKRGGFNCPHGHGKMSHHTYAGNAKLFIDRCETCGGIWLDPQKLFELWKMTRPKKETDKLVMMFAQETNPEKIPQPDTQRIANSFLFALLSKNPLGIAGFFFSLIQPLIISEMKKPHFWEMIGRKLY
jgi:Zn-finger nucleic acid-binding protein